MINQSKKNVVPKRQASFYLTQVKHFVNCYSSMEKKKNNAYRVLPMSSLRRGTLDPVQRVWF